MTLYLKYRPQKIADLDLKAVRETLGNILNSKNIPHAFLFTGSKGTGKTSSARILAKALNCEKNIGKETLSEPCNECDQCTSITSGNNIDVIEMDAASNRGIDDIRVLRENIKLSPAKSKYKIYIVDEAHMLTTEAANAFLKTLEEPPAHVIFILATTNPEKLPQTIQSRLTTVNFNRASEEEITSKLKKIADGENFKIDNDAYNVISKAADGSFRDAVKNLEILSLQTDHITKQFAQEYLFQGNIIKVDYLLDLIKTAKQHEAILEVERVASLGGSMKLYLDELISSLHKKLLLQLQGDKDEWSVLAITQLIKAFEQAKQEINLTPIVQLPLELAISTYLEGKAPESLESNLAQKSEESVASTTTKVKEVKTQSVAKPPVEKPESLAESVRKVNVDKKIAPEDWTKILTNIKEKNASIEALLRSSQPMSFDGKILTLGVYYKFHKERLEVGNNRKTLEEVLASTLGASIRVDCVLTEKPPLTVKKDVVLVEPKEDIVDAAKEIFGA